MTLLVPGTDADTSAPSLHPWPEGPAVVYITGRGDMTRLAQIDRTAVDGDRDRALCRALLNHALSVLDKAEQNDARHPVGFQPPTERP